MRLSAIEAEAMGLKLVNGEWIQGQKGQPSGSKIVLSDPPPKVKAKNKTPKTPRKAAGSQISGPGAVLPVIRHVIHSEGTLNATEREFKLILERDDQFKVVAIQDIILKVGSQCWYVPDFRTVDNNGKTQIWDVIGGFIWEDSKIKIKACAEKFSDFDFYIAQKKRGQWKIKAVKKDQKIPSGFFELSDEVGEGDKRK